MSKIVTVLKNGTLIETTGNGMSEEQISKTIISRQQIAHDYCIKKGWSTNPSELSFEQILEIRELPEWKNAIK